MSSSALRMNPLAPNAPTAPAPAPVYGQLSGVSQTSAAPPLGARSTSYQPSSSFQQHHALLAPPTYTPSQASTPTTHVYHKGTHPGMTALQPTTAMPTAAPPGASISSYPPITTSYTPVHYVPQQAYAAPAYTTHSSAAVASSSTDRLFPAGPQSGAFATYGAPAAVAASNSYPPIGGYPSQEYLPYAPPNQEMTPPPGHAYGLPPHHQEGASPDGYPPLQHMYAGTPNSPMVMTEGLPDTNKPPMKSRRGRVLIKKHTAGCCGSCNSRGCCDREAACGCWNCRGCCDRERLTYHPQYDEPVEAAKVSRQARRSC